LLTNIQQSNLEAVGDESGIKNGNNWNFIVNGKGKVVTVNTESRKGIAEIDVEPFDGKADFILQIGPVFEGYAIRDVLDFIKFDDFSNQIEWSQLGSGYNAKTYQENLEGVRLESGVELSFTGVLTAGKSSKLLTPVIIQGGGE
jgi:predicted lipoprotein